MDPGKARPWPEHEVVERAQDQREDHKPELPVEPRSPEQQHLLPEVHQSCEHQKRQRDPADRPKPPPGLLDEPGTETRVLEGAGSQKRPSHRAGG